MKELSSISTKLLDEIVTTIDRIGIDNTIKLLREAKSNSMILNDVNIEFVLSAVSEITGLSKERILNGKERSDDRKIALGLCIFFIKNEFSYSLAEIKRIFNKDMSALSRYNSMVERKPSNPKTDFDKKLNSHFKMINLLITEKKIANGKK